MSYTPVSYTHLDVYKRQLYETLREDILANKYEPGEELQIDKLAQEFGVSTTPIREALVRLEGDGLVVSIPNRGVQVAPISLDDVRNLYEVRRLLEPYVAKIAARYCEEGEVEALYEKLVHLIEGPTDLAAYINADLELHELMSQHLRNTLLKDILDQVDQHSIRVRYLAESSAGGLRPEVVELVTREHLKICLLYTSLAHRGKVLSAFPMQRQWKTLKKQRLELRRQWMV